MKIHIQENILYIQSEVETTLEEILQHFLIPRKQRYLLFQHSAILLNDTVLGKDHVIHAEDTLMIHLPTMVDDIEENDTPIDVVYEDELFLMVNKPVGIIVHSDGKERSNTLNNYVKAYYVRNNITSPVRPIHRLDKETSGIVIYCKIPFFQPLLDHWLEDKFIQRIYLALLQGNMKEKEVIVRKAIGRDRHNAAKMRISKDGSSAWTNIIRKKVLNNITLCECHLKTGRTHQIRVHAASIGHPIVSDPLYGTMDNRIDRCALHAWIVKFYHPLLQQQMEIECELPEDMLKIVRGKGKSAK